MEGTWFVEGTAQASYPQGEDQASVPVKKWHKIACGKFYNLPEQDLRASTRLGLAEHGVPCGASDERVAMEGKGSG